MRLNCLVCPRDQNLLTCANMHHISVANFLQKMNPDLIPIGAGSSSWAGCWAKDRAFARVYGQTGDISADRGA